MPNTVKASAHFEADFENGTTYIQGADDVSIDTDGKNAFYDVLQRMDEVVRFHIVKENGDRYTVDLTDGHFEVNGLPFWSHDQFYKPKGKLKLIYFKEMHQNFKMGEEDPYEIRCNRYFIGWEDEAHKAAETNEELMNPEKAVANGKATLAVPGD